MRAVRPLKLAVWMAGVCLASGSQVAHACAACFGKSDSALARGMNMGIFALLGFIGTVLAGIACVGVYFAMRASRLERQNARQAETPVSNV